MNALRSKIRVVLIEARDAVGVVRDVLGDKGFDSDAVRDVVLDDLDALPVIPNRSHRKTPWPWDDEMRGIYKQRNRVERVFAKASSSAASPPDTRSSRTSTSASPDSSSASSTS
jgi:transposase